MTESFDKGPQSPLEWRNEVHLTKVRDRIVLLKNQSSKRFNDALAMVAESNEFIGYGAPLEVFISRKSSEAKRFVEVLGSDIDLVTSAEDVSPEQFMEHAPKSI